MNLEVCKKKLLFAVPNPQMKSLISLAFESIEINSNRFVCDMLDSLPDSGESLKAILIGIAMAKSSEDEEKLKKTFSEQGVRH